MINILVSLNESYIPALKVMLKSMFENNRGQAFSIYFMYSDISEAHIEGLKRYVETEGQQLNMVFVNPDIVVLNSLVDFYYSEFKGAYYIASEHRCIISQIQILNKLRLGNLKANGYFNTGVLLMNLKLLKYETCVEDILTFIRENKEKLLLPDQDAFNMLYWDKIKAVDCFKYNYDAKYYKLNRYLVHKKDIHWIKENTVFIHYCGKHKPWHNSCAHELAKFYSDYEKMIER